MYRQVFIQPRFLKMILKSYCIFWTFIFMSRFEYLASFFFFSNIRLDVFLSCHNCSILLYLVLFLDSFLDLSKYNFYFFVIFASSTLFSLVSSILHLFLEARFADFKKMYCNFILEIKNFILWKKVLLGHDILFIA